MKRFLIIFLLALAASLVQCHIEDAGRIHALENKAERFENRAVFHNAEKVSKLTHAPLYQVLTGKLDKNMEVSR